MTRIQNPKDFWAGLIYVAVGLAAIVIARNYEMGSALRMGPAYFPTVLGGLLTLIGAASIARSLLVPGEPIGRLTLKGILLVCGATILFAVLVRGAGLVVAIVVLVLVSSYASVRFNVRSAVLLTVGLAVFCVLVFVKALGVPLPVVGSWFGG